MGSVNLRDLSAFLLTVPVNDPKGVLSAVFGIHIARMCGAEPQRQTRDFTVPVLLGIRCELSAELFISEHSFSPRSKI